MNYYSWKDRSDMRSSALSSIRKRLGKRFDEKLERCRLNLELNAPQLLEVCKTCRNFMSLGNVANYGVVFPSNGCAELGICVNELWHCGKWSGNPDMMPSLDNLKINNDIVTEAVAMEENEVDKSGH